MLDKRVKKSARNDKRIFLNAFARRAEEAANRHDLGTLYRSVRSLTSRRNNTNALVLDKNGNTLSSEDQQLRRWKQHFDELLNGNEMEPDTHGPNEAENPAANRHINTNPPSINEISEAIKTLKMNKAPGLDGIPAELLQIDAKLTASLLHQHIKQAWENEQFAKDWKEGVIIVGLKMKVINKKL